MARLRQPQATCPQTGRAAAAAEGSVGAVAVAVAASDGAVVLLHPFAAAASQLTRCGRLAAAWNDYSARVNDAAPAAAAHAAAGEGAVGHALRSALWQAVPLQYGPIGFPERCWLVPRC